MPRAAIESSTATPGNEKYREPHERSNGPWDEYEKDDAGRTLERAEKIKANGKFVAEIAKHHQKKSKHHHEIASKLKHHMKSGLVSDKALERAASRKRG